MDKHIAMLQQIKEDEGLPRNIKSKIEEVITALQTGNVEDAIKANRALQILEELSRDPNLPIYIRTQIWNLASLLEGAD
ncbi:UPF0147 family protein [archaeon]|nr:UPF0147 family protein [archaeon]